MTAPQEKSISEITSDPEEGNLEWAKLDLDRQKVMHELTLRSLELDLKRRDLAIKERELDLKHKEHRRSRWTNPLFIGLLALAASVFSAVSTMKTNIQVAQDKDQSDLVIEAIKSGDPINARENLLFLADAGRLRDSAAIKRAAQLHSPSLPAVISASPVDAAETKSGSVLFGKVQDEKGKIVPNVTVKCETTETRVEDAGGFHCEIPQGRTGINIHVAAPGFQPKNQWISAKEIALGSLVLIRLHH